MLAPPIKSTFKFLLKIVFSCLQSRQLFVFSFAKTTSQLLLAGVCWANITCPSQEPAKISSKADTGWLRLNCGRVEEGEVWSRNNVFIWRDTISREIRGMKGLMGLKIWEINYGLLLLYMHTQIIHNTQHSATKSFLWLERNHRYCLIGFMPSLNSQAFCAEPWLHQLSFHNYLQAPIRPHKTARAFQLNECWSVKFDWLYSHLSIFIWRSIGCSKFRVKLIFHHFCTHNHHLNISGTVVE